MTQERVPIKTDQMNVFETILLQFANCQDQECWKAFWYTNGLDFKNFF